MVRLDIFSDPVCPWCYIGKGHLDRALEAHPDHPFAIEWQPFQLNPDMPPEGVDRAEWLEARFGSRQKVIDMHVQIERIAAEAGVTMDFARMSRIPNTLDAHRMIHWAGLEEKQTPMVAALFRAYWREGRDIGQPGLLAELGEEVGLDRKMTERLLASEADRQMILDRDRHARSRGINAVPTYIIADRYAVSGAQPPTLWAQVIEELAEKAKE
ncbi:DsbA family oxidoreductase [Tabrizicola sp. J26]|uniref:DsbA family oxidoreductase n=1 Tax=Alitabrizicola rongguiensis TaxID=2909234 RepID=UPI001F1BDD76|nr:DsbA family oxidoreductase [Tabrizicola rongguiensis]MCF1709831.1 DsbA family oxidoreductase [Tabrizicola rongguiensis]